MWHCEIGRRGGNGTKRTKVASGTISGTDPASLRTFVYLKWHSISLPPRESSRLALTQQLSSTARLQDRNFTYMWNHEMGGGLGRRVFSGWVAPFFFEKKNAYVYKAFCCSDDLCWTLHRKWLSGFHLSRPTMPWTRYRTPDEPDKTSFCVCVSFVGFFCIFLHKLLKGKTHALRFDFPIFSLPADHTIVVSGLSSWNSLKSPKTPKAANSLLSLFLFVLSNKIFALSWASGQQTCVPPGWLARFGLIWNRAGLLPG